MMRRHQAEGQLRLAALVAAATSTVVGLLAYAPAAVASAHVATPEGNSSFTTNCPVLVAPSAWPAPIGGAGVYVCNNLGGSTQQNVQVTTFGSPPFSSPWQCVELAGRFWQTQQWPLGSVFGVTHAYQIWTQAQQNTSIVSTVANGSVSASNVFPGDLIVVNGNSTFPDGHVAVVTQVTSSQVNVFDQNYGGGSYGDYGHGTYTLNNGTLTRSGDARTVLGVVHNLSDHFGQISNAIAPASWALVGVTGNEEIFTITPAGKLWEKWYTPGPGTWSSWYDHGAPSAATLVGRPEAWVDTVTGNEDVYVRDKAGSYWVIWYTPSVQSWSGWYPLGSPGSALTSDPVVLKGVAGNVNLYGIAAGKLWTKWYTPGPGTWSSWYGLGAPG